MTLLQIRFQTDAPWDDYDGLCMKVAEQFNAVPGLRWKLWTFEEGAGSGVYLFENAADLDAYLDGPIVAKVKSGEFGLRNVEIWTQKVHTGPSVVTRAPI
jgi:hypothetical protein